MAFGLRVSASNNIFVYGAGLYSFFNNYSTSKAPPLHYFLYLNFFLPLRLFDPNRQSPMPDFHLCVRRRCNDEFVYLQFEYDREYGYGV